jgi:hypothetical protein
MLEQEDVPDANLQQLRDLIQRHQWR